MVNHQQLWTGLFAAIGGNLFITGTGFWLNGFIMQWWWAFVIAGLASALYSKKIMEKTGLNKHIVSFVGIFTVFIGLHTRLDAFVPQYFYVFILAGIGLILLKDALASKIPL